MTPARLSRLLALELALALPILVMIRADGVFEEATLVPKLLVFRVAAAFLLATLGALFLTGNMPWRARAPILLAAAFLAWALFASLLSQSPWISLLGEEHRFEGWLGYVGYLAFWLAGRRFDDSIVTRRWMWTGLAVLAAVSTVALLQQFDLGSGLLSSFPSLRSPGTVGNPIYLGMLAALTAPILFSRLLSEDARSLTWFTALTAALVLASAYFSYSRGAWIAIPVGLLVTLGLERARLRRRWPVVGVVLAAAILVIVGVGAARDPEAGGDAPLDAAGRIEEIATGGGTVGMRVEMYKGALTLISERPLQGRGFGTYTEQGARVRTERMVEIEGYQAYPDRPHDSLLYVAYATGLPGLALLAALLLAGFGGALRAWKESTGPRRALIAGAIGGAGAYYLVELTAFSVLAVTPAFWAVLGWASAASTPARGEGDGTTSVRPSTKPARVAGVILVTLAVATGVFGSWQAVRVALADAYYKQNAETPLDLQTFETMLDRSDAIVGLWPYGSSYWNQRLLLLEEVAAQTGDESYLAKAEAAADVALARLPGDPTLSVTYADILLRRGRFHEAIAFLEGYVEADRYQADAYFNLGLAHLSAGDAESAVAPLETAVRVNPSDAEAYYYLSRALEGLGRRPEAEAALRTARGLDPDLILRLERADSQ